MPYDDHLVLLGQQDASVIISPHRTNSHSAFVPIKLRQNVSELNLYRLSESLIIQMNRQQSQSQ